MALLEILEFPDQRLRTIARPIQEVTDKTRTLIDDMFETMYAAPGVGLAATQIDVHQQLVVIDVSEDQSQPLVFINPEIKVLDDDALRDYEEGCLSVPGFAEKISRPENIEVTALDRDGNSFTMQPDGLLAVCIQHEMDHLNGKLFVDYLSNMKRNRIRSKLEKIHKQQKRA